MTSVNFGIIDGSKSYYMNVGKADSLRAASLNLIFDKCSLDFFPFDKIRDGDKILFAGCGNGQLVVEIVKKLKDRNVKIVAFDISSQQLECAREYAENEKSDGIDWKLNDIHSLDEFKGQFNFVHARFILNHLSDAKEVTKELCNTLTADGIFIGEEFAGLDFDVVSDSPEYIEAVKAWEQAIILQHAKQKSNISFAERMPKILEKIGMKVERNLKPNPVASNSSQKNVLPEGLKTAHMYLSPSFHIAIPDLMKKLIAMRDADNCKIIFRHFTQIEAQKVDRQLTSVENNECISTSVS